MPEDVVCEAVDVLLELPRQARLADPCETRDRDDLGLPFVGRAVEEFLDEAQLPVTADERRLEARRAQRSLCSGHHAQRSIERHRLGLALQLVAARVLVGDRRLRGAFRRLADQHRARLGRGLNSRRRVDHVARDHALPLGAERDGGLTREYAGTCLEPGAELGHSRDQVERGTHRPLGVVLVCDRSAPDGHHRVADELLDRAAVPLDHRPGRLEVTG